MCIISAFLAILVSCLKSFWDKNWVHTMNWNSRTVLRSYVRGKGWSIFSSCLNACGDDSRGFPVTKCQQDRLLTSHNTAHTFSPAHQNGRVTPACWQSRVHTWSRWSPRLSWSPGRKTAGPRAWGSRPLGAFGSPPSACSSHPWPGG